MRTALSIAMTMTLAFFTQAAMAQDNPPPANGTADANAQVTAPKVQVAAGGGTTAKADVKEDDGVTDHEKVVGKFGVGYMGLTQLPIGGGGAGAVTTTTIDAPVIGVRYWMMEKLGIDIGLGFAFFGGSRETETNNTTVTVDAPAAWGLAIHGGVPLVFAHAKHYKFLIIPEINLGITHRTEKSNANPAPPDITHSGFRMDLGGRIGSEIHFGFIGVPQLSLQATVGLAFTHLAWKNSQDSGPAPAGPATPISSSVQSNGLSTSVQSDPWALFVNNISALYYFP